jgi:hypothetical protein
MAAPYTTLFWNNMSGISKPETRISAKPWKSKSWKNGQIKDRSILQKM